MYLQRRYTAPLSPASPIGRFLLAHVRGEDVACRYGGEEFTLILPGASLEATRTRTERVRQDFESLRVEFGGRTLELLTVDAQLAPYGGLVRVV